MRIATRTLLLFTLNIGVIAYVPAAQTITDRIRDAQRNPDVPIVIGVLGEPPILTLAELIKASDLVVEARVMRLKSFINDRDTAVLTDFAILPSRVLVGSVPIGVSTPGTSTALTLRTYGGTVVRDGISVQAVNHNMKPLMDGRPYLLFLKRSRNAVDVYEIYNAAAFELSDVAKPLAIGGADLFRDVANRPYSELVKETTAVSGAR